MKKISAMSFKRLLVLALVVICVCTMIGCSSQEKKDNTNETTKKNASESEKYDNFADFVKSKYDAEPFHNTTENTYSYAVAGDEGEVANTFIFRYFKSEKEAKEYYDFTAGIYSNTNLTEYKAGDEGIMVKTYMVDADGKSIEDDNTAYYLLVVLDGCNVYYTDSKEGGLDLLEEFIDKMMK